MSNEREEIRWKFQLFIENIKTATQWTENQRQILSNAFDSEVKEIEKIRNLWLSGI